MCCLGKVVCRLAVFCKGEAKRSIAKAWRGVVKQSYGVALAKRSEAG